jgi:cobalamin biosynthesis protein CobT
VNNELVILREAIKKLIPMIAGRGLKVTQIGTQAYVMPNQKTGMPERVNIPNIPDNASDEFIQAIQGFIDHEVAHVLKTDFLFKAGEKSPRLHNLHNIIEDTWIEREMGNDFPGSKGNIERLSRYYIQNVTSKAIASAADEMEEFHYLFVVLMRALAGHVPFQEYMDDNNFWERPLVKAFLQRFPDEMKKRLPRCASTAEAFEIALECEKILYPPPPPAPPQPQPQQNEEQSEEQKSSDKDEDDSDNSESDEKGGDPSDSDEEQDGEGEQSESGEGEDDQDHSDEEQAGDGEGDGEREHTKDSDDASGGEEGENEEGDEAEDDADAQSGGDGSDDGDEPQNDAGEEDESGKGGKSKKDKSDADEDAGSGDADPSEDGDESGEDDGADQNADDPADPADEGEPDDGADEKGGSDAAGDDDQGSEEDKAGQDQGEGDDDAEGEDADGDSDGNEGDRDGESDDASGDDADEEQAGKTNLAVEVDNDDGNSGSPVKEDEDGLELAGVGYDGTNPFQEMRDDDLKNKDLSSSIAIIIQRQAIQALHGADYSVYTRELDVIQPLPVPAEFKNDKVQEMEEETRAMTGVMQKDIERMMAAQSRVFNVAGQRSGRLNGPSLHRLVAGDARVFGRREEIRAKDTAVMLLNDCSGSMRNRKISTAMASSYALSSTLERVNIPHEVMGFTTGGHWHTGPITSAKAEELARQAMEEMRKTGVRFSRVSPIYMPIFKEFHERLNSEVKRRFAYMRNVQPNMGNNIDGESLEYAAMRLAKRKEKRKVIIVLSDGFPAGAHNDDEHLKYMTERLTNMGFDLVGIGIESAAVERFYENNLVLNSVAELPGAVMGKLRSILSK